MYFRKYWLQKVWFDKCLKGRVSEDPYTENTVNGSKHCSNVNDSTLTILINQCEGSCIERSLF